MAEKGERKLVNQLKESTRSVQADTHNRIKADSKLPRKKHKDDIFDFLLRGGLTLISAGFLTGFVYGILEAATGSRYEFHNPVVLVLMFVLIVFFWILYLYRGPFKRKYID
ncbi:MAG: hypothetical protein JJU13_04130 [Balneolaceae bacterium]|nr:hypothetical protein [Balneolaceae bacterium]